jgi:uncharacterized protein YdhG (YjbR/CyaY superfamily)
MTERSKFTDIDGYIASAPLEVRPILEGIRRTAKAKAPDAIETINWSRAMT